jgi:hypothetical protein
MYGGFEVYKTYLAVKLHFTQASYDYNKYEGKVNAKLDTFTSRNDRYFFHKLSKKYKQDEILDFFVANFLYDDKKWIKNLLENDGKEQFLAYRKYNGAFAYHFKSDCVSIVSDFNKRGISFNDGFLCHNGQHPRLLQLLIQKKTSYQTAIAIDDILSYSKNWSVGIKEKVIWPKIAFKMAKLKGFLNYNSTECKMIMKDIFV